MKLDLRVYLVTDPAYSWLPRLGALIGAGVTVIQVRAKDLSDDAVAEQVRRAIDIARPKGVPVLVNDRVEVALQTGADGVHLGQRDEGIASARRRLGKRAFIGLSIDELAQTPEEPGADYLAASPVWTTPTKLDTAPPLGLDGVRALRARAGRRPIVGIGGITSERAPDVIDAGASGVAVVSAILGADDPVEAARSLRRSVDDALSRSRERTEALFRRTQDPLDPPSHAE